MSKAKVIVFAIDVAIGLICGLFAAALLLPICNGARGYFAIGGEWFFILSAAYAGYTVANTYIFDRLERR